MITGALMLAVYTIVKPAAEQGWLAAETLVLGAVSVALLVGFVVRQRYARSPLMPLALFRSRNLVGANLIQLIGAAGMFGAFFLGTLYLQNLRHYDALQIGLAFLPVTICMGTLSVRYSERLITRFGARAVSPGRARPDGGRAGAARRRPGRRELRDPAAADMALLGLGAGACFPALIGLGMDGVDAGPGRARLRVGQHHRADRRRPRPGRAGHAVHDAHPDPGRRPGTARSDALLSGYHLAFWIAAAALVAALGVGAALLTKPSAPSVVEAEEEVTEDQELVAA